MEMPMGNVEKLQFPVGREVIYRPQYFPDERDGFIMWLKGEFAAANAMIDSLCQHLSVVSEPGEYDRVLSSIKDRRCNWYPVLHMQQYFPISEVHNALQQVSGKRQQRGVVKEFRRNGAGFRHGQRVEFVKGNVEKQEKIVENGVATLNGQCVEVMEDKIEKVENFQEDSCMKKSDSPQGKMFQNAESDDKLRVDCKGNCDATLGNDAHSIQNAFVKQNGLIAPKTFIANEILDGKAVNVVGGMKLYDRLLDLSEVTKILPLVNDIRAAGKRGDLQGPTFVWSKRPMKGHGREMIQLGLANAVPEDQSLLPILPLLQDVIDCLVSTEVLPVKPDSCIIDVFNEGDHSQPQMWPSWYGRPVSVLFLTECEMSFGKFTGAEYSGDYKGSLRLSLQPGSLLVMQGNSANIAKYALSSFKKQRILITLTKLQPRKPAPADVHCLPSPAVPPIPHWVSLPSRSPNQFPHSIPKHYGATVTNGVLPAPPVRPQLGPSSGMHPLFGPLPVAPAMHFPAPVAMPPRLPLPGTGVFLPPGSNHSSPVSVKVTEASFCAEMVKENGLINPGESKLNNKDSHTQCNGSSNGAIGGGKFVTKEEQQQDVNPQAGNQASKDT